MSDRIVAVAIRRRDGLVLTMPAPARHNDLYRRAAWLIPRHRWPIRGEQGFLTNEGRFVGREEARRIAVAASQIVRGPHHARELFSEDLW